MTMEQGQKDRTRSTAVHHCRDVRQPQSVAFARAEIVEAAATGAHAIKLQTYTADSMTLPHNDGEFFISDEVSLWKGEGLHALYRRHLHGNGTSRLWSVQQTRTWMLQYTI